MATYTKFYCFAQDLALGKHNFATNQFKVALTNTVPALTALGYSALSEISGGSYGYTAGGIVVPITENQAVGVEKIFGTAISALAFGGDIGPLQCAVLYNNTHADKPLIGFWDYGSLITLTSGQSLAISFNGTTGIFQIS